MDPYTLQILLGILKGFFYGLIATGIGYVKSETWETFKMEKFLQTIIIGGIIGGIAGTGYSLHDASVVIGKEFNVDPIFVETSLMVAIVAFADNIVKIISRRTDLGKLWAKIKGFFGKKLSASLKARNF